MYERRPRRLPTPLDWCRTARWGKTRYVFLSIFDEEGESLFEGFASSRPTSDFTPLFNLAFGPLEIRALFAKVKAKGLAVATNAVSVLEVGTPAECKGDVSACVLLSVECGCVPIYEYVTASIVV